MARNISINGISWHRQIDKFVNFLLDIWLLISVLSITFFLLFRIPIENALNKILVDPVLQYVNQIWYNDILLLFLSVVLAARSITLYEKEKSKAKFISLETIFLFIGLIYLGYRVLGSTWVFTPSYFLPFIKYADLYLVFVLIKIATYWFKAASPKEKETQEETSESFFEDIELAPNDHDLLGYEPYAKQIAEKIELKSVNKSFAIGINAKWGHGKSSFINLIKKHIHSDEIITVDFKPWFSNTPDSIIKDFFESLIEKIPGRNKSLTSLLKKYSDKLLSINNSSTIQLFLTIFNDSEKEPVSKIYNEINDQLLLQNKKLIIYIDDMDRLNNEEIIEVIKLIRNTANFINTYYIVAYDRDYIVSALKNHTDFRRQEFLEKIFQLEVSLPVFKSWILRNKLIDNLKRKLPIKYYEIAETINGSNETISLNYWVQSLRDVTRLSNSLSLNYMELIGEVDFDDFFKLELLRVKYPSLYHLISKRKNEFFETDSKNDGKLRYFLKKNIIPDNESKEQINKSLLKEYLKDDVKNLCLSVDDIEKIEGLLASIFGFNNKAYLIFENRSVESVVYPSKFDRYFAYRLIESEISNKDFNDAMELSQKEFNDKILLWIGQGKENEVIERFRDLKKFESSEHYVKHIKAIFYLANIKKITSEGQENRVLFNPKDLIQKLIPGETVKAEKYFNDDVIELKAFVMKIFETASSPFYFEAETLRYAKRYLIDDFILTSSEMDELSQKYLANYINEIGQLSNDLWHLYYCCKNYEKVPNSNNSYSIKEIMPENANQIMREFVLINDPELFVKQILQPYMIKEHFYTVISEVKVMFGTWDKFYAEIEKIKDTSELISEFFEFLKKCKAVEFKEYVEFNFSPDFKLLK